MTFPPDLDRRWNEWNDSSQPLRKPLGELCEEIGELIRLKASMTVTREYEYRDFYGEVWEELQKKYGIDKIELSAEAVVVKGTTNVIALNQLGTFNTIFGIDMKNKNIKYSADVSLDTGAEDEQPPKIKTRIVWTDDIKPETPDRVLVSQTLANKLGVQTGGRLVVSRVYQDLDTVDLDKFI